MSGLANSEKILQHHSRAAKTQVAEWSARDLGASFPGIESAPNVANDDA